ncbi:MAG: methyltransferase domain-containing protein [Candidatus Scalindua sp. AMX11]|nr:MAG: methyltransferase domain-containing protein [Candidatus Scalindua sp.]NOG84082.1 methyltransferase domain-containing protein [Planctomycetota bacterium]RZV62391.1 MAG: methyltransferase domain-containing protein [Candidatus Scalindua sp. SCAELEC01]TDE63318.1 MAG: methyltransferase domain-containing protein [Candidatus Scalindua sp. AMX11]GJQ57529.1 MAG: methyltransferase [Candidatus Scalindua sp.]
MKRIYVLLFSSLVLIFTLHPCTLLLAQEAAGVASPSGVSEINKGFLDPEMNVESFVERFEVESREVYHVRDDIMRHLNLKPGERIADVGAGTGYYSLLMADAVGDIGWVYAVEISPRFVEHLAKLFDQHKKTNVTTVMCNDNSVCLPPGSVDAAFICDAYHHFEHPEQTMTSIFEAMIPGGRLIVIDFERIVGVTREWTLHHVRAGKQTFIDEIKSVGFELAAERKIPGFKENYYLEFQKP